MESIIAVAFDLNQQQSAELYHGISSFVRDHNLQWQLLPMGFGFESKLMDLARSGKLDGVIGTFVSDRWVQSLLQTGVTAVNVFNFSKIETVPSVSLDDDAIGSEAGRHLRNQGAREFIFMGSDGIYSTQLRAAGFQRVLGERCRQLGPNANLKEFLRERPRRPKLGIFCTSDHLARQAILTAQACGYELQKDYCILGVDNDPAESIFAGVAISSFQLPIQEVGALAARALSLKFRDPKSTATYPPVGSYRLFVRESSLTSPGDLTAERARQFMEANLTNPELNIELICKQAGTSRRNLELNFRRHFSTSPFRYLSQIRLNLAESLLLESSYPVMEVGRRCGYPGPHHFSVWFKKQTGQSPKQYRLQANARAMDETSQLPKA